MDILAHIRDLSDKIGSTRTPEGVCEHLMGFSFVLHPCRTRESDMPVEFNGDHYVAMRRPWLLSEATNPASSRDLKTRLEFLAMAKMNRVGHAHFKVGEIAGLLERLKDRKTGELRPPMDKGNLSRLIAQAVSEGLLAKGSSPTLLIVPASHAQYAAKSYACPVCSETEWVW